jgi:hypothetical protein
MTRTCPVCGPEQPEAGYDRPNYREVAVREIVSRKRQGDVTDGPHAFKAMNEAEFIIAPRRFLPPSLHYGDSEKTDATIAAPINRVNPMSHHAWPSPPVRCLAWLGRARTS